MPSLIHGDSAIGLTAAERIDTLSSFSFDQEDDSLITWDGDTAYFLGEAIGKLTKQGKWNRAWKSFGLYSSLNGIASIEIEAWDPNNIIGKLAHIHEREYKDLIGLRREWIARIRNAEDKTSEMRTAKATLIEAQKELIALNESRAHSNQIEAIKDRRSTIELQDALDKEALERLQGKLLEARAERLATTFYLNSGDLAEARTAAEQDRINYDSHIPYKHMRDTKLDTFLHERLTRIHERIAPLSHLPEDQIEEGIKQISGRYFRMAQMNPWAIIPNDTKDLEAKLLAYATFINDSLNSQIGYRIYTHSQRLPFSYKEDSELSKARSSLIFMAFALNTLRASRI